MKRIVLIFSLLWLVVNLNAQTLQQKILIDFGPNGTGSGNSLNGIVTASPDVNGNYWNNAISPSLNANLTLVNAANASTGFNMVVTAGMNFNGKTANGGLASPNVAALGDLVVENATLDFFFTNNATSPGGFKITNLNPAKGYKFYVFGSRATAEIRTTKYTFTGSTTFSGTQQNSGTNLGGTGYNGNNSTVLTSDLVYPTAGGEISIALDVMAGQYGYLNVMKIEEYSSPVINVSQIDVSGEGISAEGGTSQITALVLPEDATVKSMVWSVSDPSIATINADGLLTAHTNGEVTVTATSTQSGTPVSGSIQVIVSNQPDRIALRKIYIDFGKDDVTNGNQTLSPDVNGNYWNNALDPTITAPALPLVDYTNASTNFNLVVAAGMSANGIVSGGLLSPNPNYLGELAIATATQDYFFTTNSTTPGALKLTGLDASKAYRFIIFGSRNAADTRFTNYTFTGANTMDGSLQNAGANLGGTGYNGNNSSVFTSELIFPTAGGEITIGVSTGSNSYAYVNVMKIEEYAAPIVDVTSIQVSGSDISLAEGTSQMTAEVIPSNATVKDIVWSVSDPSVATINADGLLSAHSNGEVTVTATSTQAGTHVSGSVQITISNQFELVALKKILIDFGKNDVTNGNITDSPDVNGNYWNNAIDPTITASALPLVNIANEATGFNLVVAAGMGANGILSGGLLSPNSSYLGEMAVATATQDYFFTTNATTPGALKITGLEIGKAYRFFIFGSRNAPDSRSTIYTFTGANTRSGSLQNAGTNLGGTGYNGNNSSVYTSDLIFPSAGGEITLGISTGSNSYAYVNVMKMEEYIAPVVEVAGINVSGSDISLAGGISQMSAEVLPSEATVQGVVWSVSDPSIATINANGLLTAHSNGELTVTATSTQTGTPVLGTAQINVSNQFAFTATRKILIDFGKNDVTNGNITESPDMNGNYWNNAINPAVTAPALPLVDFANAPTGFELLVAAGMSANGIVSGGLLSPNSSYLGEMAIATATQDYFFTTNATTPGALKITGLDATKGYRFFIFGSRNATDTRYTNYSFSGANTIKGSLQNAGANLGGTGYNGNNSTVFTSEVILPTENGDITIDISTGSNTYAYVNVMKIEEYTIPIVDVESINISGNNITVPGATSQLVAEVLPLDATNKSVTWTVDNSAIASISANGLLIPKGNGTVTVTATSKQVSSTISTTKQITISNQVTLLYFSGSASEKGGDFDQGYLMHKVTDKSGALTGIFELYTSFSDTGRFKLYTTTDYFTASAFGASDIPGTIKFYEYGPSVQGIITDVKGPVLLRVNLNNNTYSITPITKWSIVGSTIPNKWNGDVPLDYKGNGVWSSTVDLTTPTTDADARRFVFRANGSWDYVMKKVAGTTNSVRMESEAATYGYTVGDIPVSYGTFVVTLDLLNYTYSVECISVDPLKISVMGSSGANGVGATNNHGYAFLYGDLLKQRHESGLGADWSVSGLSINGNNTLSLSARWNDDLLTDCSSYVIYGLVLGNEGIIGGGQPIFDQYKNNMLLLIDKARAAGKTPVVSNNYIRNDYTATEYEYIRKMNMLIHEWDVPSTNLLGAVDNGSGRYAAGYFWDALHPNDLGHAEMSYAIVPSLFDALQAGKGQPVKVEGTYLSMGKKVTYNQLQLTPQGTLHSFTSTFDFKTSGTGTIASFSNSSSTATFDIDETGAIVFVSPAGGEIKGTYALNDNQWHKVSLTNYYARGEVLLYVDNNLVGNLSEKMLAEDFFLNDTKAPEMISYRDWYFHRSGMNADEMEGLYAGKMLKSSLELYAPLDGQAVTGTDPLINLAQSTNALFIKVNIVDRINGSSKNSQYKIYPNPVSNVLKIQGLKQGVQYECTIFGADGCIALEKELKNQGELNVSSLSNSVYILQLKDKNSSEKVSISFRKIK